MLQAFAAEFVQINTNLPTSNGSTIDPAAGIAGMIGSIYTYLLSIAGAIAFLSIVYAGMQWALSQGNPSKISDAKDRIWQAFYGIALLFGAYLILAMVNPSLTFLKMPTLKPIQMPAAATPTNHGYQTADYCKPTCQPPTICLGSATAGWKCLNPEANNTPSNQQQYCGLDANKKAVYCSPKESCQLTFNPTTRQTIASCK